MMNAHTLHPHQQRFLTLLRAALDQKGAALGGDLSIYGDSLREQQEGLAHEAETASTISEVRRAAQRYEACASDHNWDVLETWCRHPFIAFDVTLQRTTTATREAHTPMNTTFTFMDGTQASALQVMNTIMAGAVLVRFNRKFVVAVGPATRDEFIMVGLREFKLIGQEHGWLKLTRCPRAYKQRFPLTASVRTYTLNTRGVREVIRLNAIVHSGSFKRGAA